MAVVDPPLPYQLYLGRTPSYDRVYERDAAAETALDIFELHVEYWEHGWYVYRRHGNAGFTEVSPSGEERWLTDNRSQFIRRPGEEQCTVLPNLVQRWTFHNECLVYQLVAQRSRMQNMSGHVVSTLAGRIGGAGPPAFDWQDAHGRHIRARAISWNDGTTWRIIFQAFVRSERGVPGAYYAGLTYSRMRRCWLLGHGDDAEAVPQHIARQLSNAIGFRTRDGFSSLNTPGGPLR